MSEELPKLPDDLRALLDAAAPPEPPPGLEDKLLQSLRPAWASTTPAPAPSSLPHAKTGLKAALGKFGLGLAAATLLLGGAIGLAIGRATVTPPPPRIVEVKVPVPTPMPVLTPPPLQQEKPAAEAKVEPKAPQKKTRDEDLAEEQRLIEMARTALLRREPTLALVPLKEHAQKFPHGQLAEEREALWIQVLANSGDMSEARSRADAFKRKYPNSLLLPAVDMALQRAK